MKMTLSAAALRAPVLAAAAAAALLSAAPAVSQAVTLDEPMLSVEDVVVRAGNALEFSTVRMDQAGFIVVHEGLDGRPAGPGALTHVFVNPGAHQGVLVPLEGGYQPGKEYILSLHYDSNGNGTYDHESDPAVDGPVVRADGSLYQLPFVMQAAQ